jgi:hypothetical protein
MKNVLLVLCKVNVNIMNGWHPYPARLIAEDLGITIHQARYQLNKLREQGLVKVVTEVIGDEDGYLPYRGWSITEKAKQTKEYQKAFEREREICQSIFGIDIGVEKTLYL